MEKKLTTQISSWARLACLFFILTTSACSPSSDSAKPAGDTQKYGTKAPSDLPPLPANYRPLNLSFKSFEREGVVYSPVDLDHQILTLTFDVSAQKVIGHSTVFFHLERDGRPFLHLNASVLSARINGEDVLSSLILDPDGLQNSYLSFAKNLAAGSFDQLEIEYVLPKGRVEWNEFGMGFLTDMTDLLPGQFFENWGPVGFEADNFSMSLSLKLEGSNSAHQVWTNGSLRQMASDQWQIDFPNHFTASSFYVHLTNKLLNVEQLAIKGLERSIPVTIYSSNAALVQQVKAVLPTLFQELERDYGPYPHPSFIAYLHSGGGGMEYLGATVTSPGALGHELFHSWFARGVMPAEGRSGWIDEALASWRDYNYFQASSLLSRPPTVLAKYSPFRKSTPSNCYVDGRKMIAELDLKLAEFGGMKPLLRSFFERYKYRTVTTEEFQLFLTQKTKVDVSPFFDRYIFGLSNSSSALMVKTMEVPEFESFGHPRPLSASELKELR
jgi:hypothetical protein